MTMTATIMRPMRRHHPRGGEKGPCIARLLYRKPVPRAMAAVSSSAGEAERSPHHLLSNRKRVMLLEVGVAAITNALAQRLLRREPLDAFGEALWVGRD